MGDGGDHQTCPRSADKKTRLAPDDPDSQAAQENDNPLAVDTLFVNGCS
jgi:hypothetical protein